MAKTALKNNILESNGLLLLVALFVIGTTFYIFPAGSIQPGQYLALIIILVGASFIRWHDLQPADKWLMVFGAYTLLVNNFYYFTVEHPDFLKSIMYWAYSIALFIALHHIIKRSNKVKSTLAYVFVLCLFIILLFLFFNVGYIVTGENTFRFIAQFNDPNQMGYWLLCAFTCICLISNNGLLNNRYVQLFILLIVALLISATGSRSSMIGLVPLVAGFFWLRFIKEKITFQKPIFFTILVSFIISLFFIFTSPVNKQAFVPDQQTALAQEVSSNRVLNTKWADEAKLRGYFRPLEYSQYLIFGAGQGYDARFNAAHEVHSSLLGVFFYYGIVGFVLFVVFLYKVFRRLNFPEALMLSAPFVYGLFTFGLRTPIFWVLMAVVVAIRPFNSDRQK